MTNRFPTEKLRRLHQKALDAALRYLGNHHQAEDAAQEALLGYCKAKEAGTVFNRTSAFVYRLGHRRAIDLLRREHKHRHTAEALDLADPGPSPSRQGAARILAEEIRLRLLGLAPTEREVFERIFFEDRSREEVARKTGLTESAVGSVFYRAKMKLGLLGKPKRSRREFS